MKGPVGMDFEPANVLQCPVNTGAILWVAESENRGQFGENFDCSILWRRNGARQVTVSCNEDYVSQQSPIGKWACLLPKIYQCLDIQTLHELEQFRGADCLDTREYISYRATSKCRGG